MQTEQAAAPAEITTKTLEAAPLLDGCELVRITADYPAVESGLTRPLRERINRYYRRLAGDYVRSAQRQLGAVAKQRALVCAAGGEPFVPFTARMSFEVLFSGRCMCVLYEQQEICGPLVRRTRFSDVFDLGTGDRLRLRDLFVRGRRALRPLRALLLRAADERFDFAGRRDGAALRRRIAALWQPEQFYLLPDGLVFYYQPGEILPAARGDFVIKLSYDSFEKALRRVKRGV